MVFRQVVLISEATKGLDVQVTRANNFKARNQISKGVPKRFQRVSNFLKSGFYGDSNEFLRGFQRDSNF